MLRTFETPRANQAYVHAWDAITKEGARVPSRNGDTYEINPGIFQIARPDQPLITNIGRPVNVAFALAEVLWILAGRRDAEMVKFYNRRITEWSDDGDYFNAPYGYRMRQMHGVDQIEDVIRTLKVDPGSRQAILNVWHPESDKGWEHVEGEWKPKITKDRACNVLAHVMIRDGKLNWLQVVRSNDLVWGVPYNFMQWMHVMQYIAARVGVGVGHYTHVADSLHVYDFNRPSKVEYFDLYARLNETHPPMVADEDVMREVFRTEEKIRTDTNPMRPGSLYHKHEEVGMYWQRVLLLLLAHRFYTEKDNQSCMLTLTAPWGDPVYSLTQMKFYWQNRWKGGDFAVSAQHQIEDFIQAQRFGRGNMEDILLWFDDQSPKS